MFIFLLLLYTSTQFIYIYSSSVFSVVGQNRSRKPFSLQNIISFQVLSQTYIHYDDDLSIDIDELLGALCILYFPSQLLLLFHELERRKCVSKSTSGEMSY